MASILPAFTTLTLKEYSSPGVFNVGEKVTTVFELVNVGLAADTVLLIIVTSWKWISHVFLDIFVVPLIFKLDVKYAYPTPIDIASKNSKVK